MGNPTADLYQTLDDRIVDPGAGGTLNMDGQTMMGCTLAVAGTYHLPVAPLGCRVIVRAIQNSTVLADGAGTVATVDADEICECLSLGGTTSAWRASLYKFGIT